MNEATDMIAMTIAAIGVLFFGAGSIGMIRLPDAFSRLHALTKADNVGLGLIVVACMLRSTTWIEVVKLAMIWVLILIASACLSFLIANESMRRHRNSDPNTRP